MSDKQERFLGMRLLIQDAHEILVKEANRPGAVVAARSLLGAVISGLKDCHELRYIYDLHGLPRREGMRDYDAKACLNLVTFLKDKYFAETNKEGYTPEIIIANAFLRINADEEYARLDVKTLQNDDNIILLETRIQRAFPESRTSLAATVLLTWHQGPIVGIYPEDIGELLKQYNAKELQDLVGKPANAYSDGNLVLGIGLPPRDGTTSTTHRKT
ncbi:hypothetical protein J4457_07235 [Candidatus Woesearchaeota archaeon]|nr:hypothetical protein [Candidatus Woesearchaeota archaeon]